MPTQVEHIVPFNRIGGVTVRVLASSAVDRPYDSRSGQTIELVFVASPRTTFKSKSKHCLARIQNYVSEWSDMSTRGLLFQ
jgi:hypothetical protein